MLILNSYSLAVSDGIDTAFAGLKKKKKPVCLVFSSWSFLFGLDLLEAIWHVKFVIWL
jgi:hypothetical protein